MYGGWRRRQTVPDESVVQRNEGGAVKPAPAACIHHRSQAAQCGKKK